MVNQIELGAADQHGKAITNFKKLMPPSDSDMAEQALKGEYDLGFLAIDRQVKAKVDGKTIGILLCKSRNDIVAEYALSDLRRPIGVSTYQLGLPSAEQLQAKLQKLLVDSRDKN